MKKEEDICLEENPGNVKQISEKLKAVGNDTRLALMGLIYIREEMPFSDLEKETGLASNKLSYHIKILKKANFIKRYKDGYIVTIEGERFLRDLGYIDVIEKIQEKEENPEEFEHKFTSVWKRRSLESPPNFGIVLHYLPKYLHGIPVYPEYNQLYHKSERKRIENHVYRQSKEELKEEDYNETWKFIIKKEGMAK